MCVFSIWQNARLLICLSHPEEKGVENPLKKFFPPGSNFFRKDRINITGGGGGGGVFMGVNDGFICSDEYRFALSAKSLGSN